MGTILYGADVANEITKELEKRALKLKENDVHPTLAIVRVGENSADISYERGATKRCEQIGIEIKNFIFPENVEENELLAVIEDINNNDAIHGCLIFRPLPKHFDENKVCQRLSYKKDVDAISEIALAKVFAGSSEGFAPCTAQACIEILKRNNITLEGKNVVVIGRSLVIGKPVAMLLLSENATVTTCHTKTNNLQEVCKAADILIVAAGKAGVVDKSYVSPGQVIVDVGINVDENGNLCGDVKTDEVAEIVSAITPVPRGVGSMTTTVLASHVIQAAEATIAKA